MIRELINSILALIVLVCILFGAAVLTGCDTVKYAECIARDNTRNPCN